MKIIIIDDDKMICFALKTIIENDQDIKVVGVGHNYFDAISLFEQTQPDVCLFDIRIGEKTGIDALKTMHKKGYKCKVLFLTTFVDDEYIKDALSYGAYGYILKDEFENIVPAIKSVYAGQTVFGKKIIPHLSTQNDNKEKKNINNFFTDILTPREIDILKLIAEGKNNKEIASSLFLSEGTVRNYISTMFEKLELRDRTQLAIFYFNTINK